MIKNTPRRDCPKAVTLICDECGAALSKGDDLKQAESHVNKDAILIHKAVTTIAGLRLVILDFCGLACQVAYQRRMAGRS